MMDLIQTARGQVYSCTCGKTLPYRKKDKVAVAEIDTRDPALDSGGQGTPAPAATGARGVPPPQPRLLGKGG